MHVLWKFGVVYLSFYAILENKILKKILIYSIWLNITVINNCNEFFISIMNPL